uniref:Uncharacterized protein n=1 Tax=Rhizophora mucronata TaxID=61149 RepID=A0A2P2LW01_RHIMU
MKILNTSFVLILSVPAGFQLQRQANYLKGSEVAYF